ncbi:hypothetical protein [Streptomyces zagrosensis]|uniref:Uncharacterized protein n=1 Tax=Streptomyces zagrosensis TaxID=1042984 RepID=A0A7W9UXQ6_9ACTN|nr:hypothetical protein [Streptomyces zagrosensis]MBB5935115.1 hypothetical protein [Streptomyces zagrosensis]
MVTVPARQGFEAVDLLRLGDSGGVGPVLHNGTCDTLGFVVPPGTAAGWDLPGSVCTRAYAGRGARAGACTSLAASPHTALHEATTAATSAAAGDAGATGVAGDGREREATVRAASPPGVGTSWLVPPADAYWDATDPAMLRAALGEAARVIEVIDRSH